MSKQTFELSRLSHIVCCDCGLVHRVSVEHRDESVFISFERDDGSTRKERREKSKSMCERLDESISQELTHDTAYGSRHPQSKNPHLDYVKT